MGDAAEPFGERLERVLNELSLSQALLAEKTLLERSTISRIIKGERHPTAETIHLIAQVVGRDVGHLVKGTDAEDRVKEAAAYVRRQDYQAVVGQLSEYEGRIHDLEMELRGARDNVAREEQRRQLAERAASDAHLLISRLEADRAELKEQNEHLRGDLKRYRDALYRAVTEVTTLRGQLRDVAAELKSNSTSSRTAAILAGVAALAGVVTAATFLGADDAGETQKAAPPRPRNRHAPSRKAKA